MAWEISFGTTRFKPLPTTVNATRLATSSLYGLSRSRSPAAGGFLCVLGSFLRMGKQVARDYRSAQDTITPHKLSRLQLHKRKLVRNQMYRLCKTVFRCRGHLRGGQQLRNLIPSG